MADAIYNGARYDILRGAVNLNTDTLKAMLVTSAYTPNIDTHRFRSDVTGEVASGLGYTTGGVTLTNKAFTQDNTNDRANFDADDPSWATASFTARGLIIYKDTGTTTTSPLLFYYDFGADKTGNGGTFVASVDPIGLISEV